MAAAASWIIRTLQIMISCRCVWPPREPQMSRASAGAVSLLRSLARQAKASAARLWLAIRRSRSSRPFLGKVLKKRFRFLEVGSFEAFGEPAVDRRQQVVGIPPLAPIGPKP